MSKTNTEPMQPDTQASESLKLDVTVRPIAPMGNLLAFANVTIGDCFKIDGFRICSGENGLYVNMPSTQDKQGKWRDVCWPVTADFRRQLNDALIEGYGQAIENLQATLEATRDAEKPSLTGALKENAGKVKTQPAKPAPAKSEQAAAMASGIAKNGGKPFWGVYSSFLQRTYDQLSQDVCINQSAVTISVFAASVFGMNDVTHLGIYDIPMISNIPNLVYLAPVTVEDYQAMLDWALDQNEHPVAIRVPAQYVSDGKAVTKDFGELNRYEVTQQGSGVAILALGSFYHLGVAAAEKIREKTGTAPTVINPYYITGQDTALLEQLKADHKVVITLEDGILDGGFGEKIARFYGDSAVKTKCFGLKKEFLDRYNVQEVLKENNLTAEQIADDVAEML